MKYMSYRAVGPARIHSGATAFLTAMTTAGGAGALSDRRRLIASAVRESGDGRIAAASTAVRTSEAAEISARSTSARVVNPCVTSVASAGTKNGRIAEV